MGKIESTVSEDSTVVKVRSLSGRTIPKVDWNFPRECFFFEGQKLVLETRTEDEDLMEYVREAEKRSDEFSIMIDEKNVFVYTDCVVEEIKKVLTVGSKGVNSIVYVKPSGRGSDQILTYMHDFENCDDKVVLAIRGR